MAYEYECEEVIKNVIKELIYFKKGKNELAEKEIDEIYAKAKAFDEIKERFEKEYKAEVFEESLYHPGNFDNSEFLEDVEHILYFEDARYVEIKEDE